MIPTILNEWTFDVIDELVSTGQNESNYHDFKKSIPEAECLTKLCCAFANSNGGFIVVGIGEINSKWEICGIDYSLELSHKFGQKLKANPTINYNLPRIIKIPNSDKVIAVFEISKSINGPHIPDISPEKRVFLKRTNKGNDYMSYEEIKYAFSNYYEKINKLKLLQIEIENNLDICEEIISSSSLDGRSYSLLSLENSSFKLLVTDTFPLFSTNYELINKIHKIKKNMLILDNELQIFKHKISIPNTRSVEFVKEHNILVVNNVKYMQPMFTEVLSELKKITEI